MKKRSLYITPGEALRMLGELQGLSQNDLTKLTGLPQTNISNLENDFTQLGKDRVLLITKALHVHPAVLLFPDFDIQSVT